MTDRADIELAFVRILSTGGLTFPDGINSEDRRERIRVTIMQRGLKDAPFDALHTFGEAFSHCYHRAVELRRFKRPDSLPPIRPLKLGERADHAVAWPGPEDDEDDDGSEDEG